MSGIVWNMENLKVCNLCMSTNISPIDKNNNICQCADCGYVFDNPRPNFNEIELYYSRNDKYDSWLAEESERNQLFKRRLKMVKRYKKSGNLLDVGAGIGQFLFFAKKDFKVKGTEISESAIKIAKQKYKLTINRGELESVVFNSKFDVITLFHVLEHVPNPSSTIKKARELMNDDGVLIIAVPNDVFGIRPWLIRLLSSFKIKKFKKYGKLGLPKVALDGSLSEIHLSHFTPKVLERFLEKNGFIVIESTLDPFYAAKGLKKIFHDFLYFTCMLAKKTLGTNLYPTIWIAARKS